MTLANQLTIVRMALVPVFMAFMVVDNVSTRLLALVIFIGAALTDLYDGKLARRLDQVTTFGKLMDPLADKLLVLAALIGFVELEETNIPAWMVVLIVGREFLITGLRSVAMSQGVAIAATREGKFKTTSQVTAIITILVFLTLNAALGHYWNLPPTELHAFMIRQLDWRRAVGLILRHTPPWLMFITTILTLVSGFRFIYQNRVLFRQQAS